MSWQEIHQFDQQITLIINSWNSSFSDPIMVFFSEKLVWVPMYLAIVGYMIWKFGWKKGLMVIAAALLTFGFCDQFSNLIKDAVGRLRPLNDEFMLQNGLHILEWGGGFSFFSAHAANAFGLATSTFIFMKKNEAKRSFKRLSSTKELNIYACWMFFWAFMVTISRVFVGRHYLGDVLAGAFIGIAAGCMMALIASAICKKAKL